jgi:hypothetical protein
MKTNNHNQIKNTIDDIRACVLLILLVLPIACIIAFIISQLITKL